METNGVALKWDSEIDHWDGLWKGEEQVHLMRKCQVIGRNKYKPRINDPLNGNIENQGKGTN